MARQANLRDRAPVHPRNGSQAPRTRRCIASPQVPVLFSRRGSFWRLFVPCAFIALAALGLTGCATVVVPPHPVANPAKVGILDHGRHSSLLIEVPDGGMVRYGYGDWRWYAEDKTDFFDGVRALFWPTEAAIGRRYFKASFNYATIAKDVGVGVERAHVFEVERERVASLIRALDGIFALNMATRI
jgi:hypothetical protein